MIEIVRGGKTYHHHTPEEAAEKGIEYSPTWRGCKKGDWVLTDDGYVVEVIAAGTSGRRYTWARIANAAFMGTPGVKMLALSTPENPYGFSGTRQRLRTKDPERRLSVMERQFVAAFLTSFDVVEAFKAATNSDPNSKSLKQRAFEYFRRANVKKEIDKGIRETFGEVGLDGDWFAKQLKALGEQASAPQARLAAIKLFGEIMGYVKTRSASDPQTAVLIASKEVYELTAESERLRLGSDETGRAISGGEEVPAAEDESGHRAIREDAIPTSSE